MKSKLISIISLILLNGSMAMAGSISMSDYILLSNGMSEAEVLYRFGPFDHETVAHGFYNDILHKTWYYIPTLDEDSNRKWITEIRFNNRGMIISLDRYKAR